MRIRSLDSSLLLTVFRVNVLPPPGFPSRGHHHVQLCFCLGVAPPSPPRHTAVLWRAIISAVCSTAVATAASTLSPLLLPVGGTALRWSPITIVTFWRRWRSFVSCPVERRRFPYPTHRSVSSERIKQSYMCCSNVQRKTRTHLNLLSIHPVGEGGGVSKRLGGNIGCKEKSSSWDSNGFLKLVLVA